MNKTFLIMVFGLVIFSIAGASASAVINGHVYSNGHGVSNASVEITCNHKNVEYKNITTTDNRGFYVHNFPSKQCNDPDLVVVTAVKGSMHGVSNGTVQSGETLGLPVDISNVNVFMTPEFSFYMGLLTLIAAVGVFFVVRKD